MLSNGDSLSHLSELMSLHYTTLVSDIAIFVLKKRYVKLQLTNSALPAKT